jgi:hypothetical protein
MSDDIPMEVFSSPSDSSLSCSTAPTTPISSPLFRPSDVDDLKLGLPQSRLGETDLRDDAVKNVCVVGAGYVGMLPQRRESRGSLEQPG